MFINSCFCLGDFRQLVGEDRHKINNIVAANHSEFSQLYRPYLDDLVDYSNGKLIKVLPYAIFGCQLTAYVVNKFHDYLNVVP